MVHTNTFKLNYKTETAHCSGGGATADTPQELVEADLTAIDRIVSFIAAIPKPTREKQYQLSSGLNPDAELTTMVGQGKGSIKAYLQTSVLYDWAVACTLNAATGTKAFRYYSPYAAAEKDLYGCFVTHYELESIIKKATMQSVDFMATQAKTASTTPIAGGGIKAFSSATPQTFKTFTVATVDAKTIANMKIQRVKFAVDNIYASDEESMQLASDYSLSPALLERDFSLELDYLINGSDTWDADTLNVAAQTVSATLTNGLFTLSPVDYIVEETNQDELEERGLVKRTAKFRSSVGSTQVKS
jgi:hypothetical protein